jgi:hypothetical protein
LKLLSEEELAAIQARADAATKGPWTAYLIAHAREDVPALLAQLRYERRRREAAEKVIGAVPGKTPDPGCDCAYCVSYNAWRAIVEEQAP